LIGSLIVFAGEVGSLDMPNECEDMIIKRVEELSYNISICSPEEKLVFRNEVEKLIQQHEVSEGMVDFLRALVDSVMDEEIE
jgi:hypothetical protein